MATIVESVLSHLGPAEIGAIANRLGVDPAQAQQAITQALPVIVGGMARNASSDAGAQALNGALATHGGSLSDLLGGLLGGGAGSAIGGAILGHVFGGNQGAVNQNLGAATGLGGRDAAALMAMLAPLVMAAIANHARSANVDAGGLGGMLSRDVAHARAQFPSVGGLLEGIFGTAAPAGGAAQATGSGMSALLGALDKR